LQHVSVTYPARILAMCTITDNLIIYQQLPKWSRVSITLATCSHFHAEPNLLYVLDSM